MALPYSALSDAGLGPLFFALPRNTHLRELRCWATGMSQAFARELVLPAEHVNTSLRLLAASHSSHSWNAVHPG